MAANISKILEYSAAKIDPAAPQFLRSYATGYAYDVIPAILKILFSIVFGGSKKRLGLAGVLKQFLNATRKGFAVSGMALAGGISIGGAKWGEGKIEPMVRKIYFAVHSKTKVGKKLAAAKLAGQRLDYEKERVKLAEHEIRIKALSTFTASTLASLISVTLLQSEFTKLDGLSLPKRTVTTPFDRPPAQKKPSVTKQSPTVDLSLFLLVRALDSIVRGTYEVTATSKPGKVGAMMRFLAGQGDSIVFAISCWRIMWCWHFQQAGLPPGYLRWIAGMFDTDPNTLEITRLAHNGEFVYGKQPSAKVAELCAGMAKYIGRTELIANPHHIHSLNCAFYHGKTNTDSCTYNSIIRFFGAFGRAFKMYAPVHALPQLIFNSGKIMKSPFTTLLKVVLSTCQSSMFLSSFVVALSASTCLTRSFIGAKLLPSIAPQVWDSGLSVFIGAAATGATILVETQRRRKELALYVAPRALYSVMQECFPNGIAKGRAGILIGRWIERWIFALATAIATTVTIMRPDLQSGMLRGIIEICIGDWNNTGKGKKLIS